MSNIENKIHPTAIIEKGAEIGNNVIIGPYSIIGKNVKIGDDCVLKSHVIIQGKTTIGNKNTIFPFAVIGEINQDLKYRKEDAEVVIGDNNTIREHCTIHIGTEGGGMVTRIKNNNLLMVNTHIAHDCLLGSNCILANNVTLAGHVELGDFVVLGGLSAVHQFVKIGTGAMIGGLSGLAEDLIPFGIAYATVGRKCNLQGINLTGLKRRNYKKENIMELSHYFKEVFKNKDSGSIVDRAKIYRNKYDNELINVVADFLSSDSSRGFCSYNIN